MALIELEDRTAAALRAQALARNLPLEKFLMELAASVNPLNGVQSVPADEVDRIVDAAAASFPVLPVFSRADIYGDHD